MGNHGSFVEPREREHMHSVLHDQGLKKISVETIAFRSSVTAINQVFASAGGPGVVTEFPEISAGSDFQPRSERSPVSVVKCRAADLSGTA